MAEWTKAMVSKTIEIKFSAMSFFFSRLFPLIRNYVVANKALRHEIAVEILLESTDLEAVCIVDLIFLADRHGDKRLSQLLAMEHADFIDFGGKMTRLVYTNGIAVFFRLYRCSDKIA